MEIGDKEVHVTEVKVHYPTLSLIEYGGDSVSITGHATHDLLHVLLILPYLLPHLVGLPLQRLLRPLDLLLNY